MKKVRILIIVFSLFYFSCEFTEDINPAITEQSTDGTDDPDCKADCDDPDVGATKCIDF